MAGYANIHPEDYDNWLRSEPEQAPAMTKPYASDLMEAYPISTKVNNPGFDDESVIEQISDKL